MITASGLAAGPTRAVTLPFAGGQAGRRDHRADVAGLAAAPGEDRPRACAQGGACGRGKASGAQAAWTPPETIGTRAARSPVGRELPSAVASTHSRPRQRAHS